MKRWLMVLLMAMLPVVELRGAVPFGLGLGLPHLPVLLVSILGNMIPVPFVILFSRCAFRWMRRHIPCLGRLADRLEARAEKKSGLIRRYRLLGLYLFVAIPLPGTGAWTGALVAALMDIRLKRAIPAILIGVLIAGLLVTLACTGVRALAFLT